MDYDAFGNALDFDPQTVGTPWLFGGDGMYDAASGVYWHGNGVRARQDFRFLQMDTYAGSTNDPISLHKYLYANANPIMGSDFSGYFTTMESLAVSSMIATFTGLIYHRDFRGTKGFAGHVAGSGIGGPDITDNLVKIRSDFLEQYRADPARQQANKQSFLKNVEGNWDIAELSARIAGGSTARLPDGRPTVTVAGNVYRQEEVNYYLYGVWANATGYSRFQCHQFIMLHRYGRSYNNYKTYEWDNLDINGRKAWFDAGYFGDFRWAEGALIPGVTPNFTKYNKTLHWGVGCDDGRINGES